MFPIPQIGHKTNQKIVPFTLTQNLFQNTCQIFVKPNYFGQKNFILHIFQKQTPKNKNMLAYQDNVTKKNKIIIFGH